eukprot:2672694-Rhodomonas_salina.2
MGAHRRGTVCRRSAARPGTLGTTQVSTGHRIADSAKGRSDLLLVLLLAPARAQCTLASRSVHHTHKPQRTTKEPPANSSTAAINGSSTSTNGGSTAINGGSAEGMGGRDLQRSARYSSSE